MIEPINRPVDHAMVDGTTIGDRARAPPVIVGSLDSADMRHQGEEQPAALTKEAAR
ncbi:MAG: hypothetical protein ACK4M0_07400 [Phreatobacter sp.]